MSKTTFLGYVPSLKSKHEATIVGSKAIESKGGSIRYMLQGEYDGRKTLPKTVSKADFESVYGFDAKEAESVIIAGSKDGKPTNKAHSIGAKDKDDFIPEVIVPMEQKIGDKELRDYEILNHADTVGNPSPASVEPLAPSETPFPQEPSNENFSAEIDWANLKVGDEVYGRRVVSVDCSDCGKPYLSDLMDDEGTSWPVCRGHFPQCESCGIESHEVSDGFCIDCEPIETKEADAVYIEGKKDNSYETHLHIEGIKDDTGFEPIKIWDKTDLSNVSYTNAKNHGDLYGMPIVKESEHEESYNDYLDEMGEASISNYSASWLLQQADPIAYQVGLNDYESSMLEEHEDDASMYSEWFDEDGDLTRKGEKEIPAIYDEFLDEMGTEWLADKYNASWLLKRGDPIAYGVGLSDYESSMEEDFEAEVSADFMAEMNYNRIYDASGSGEKEHDMIAREEEVMYEFRYDNPITYYEWTTGKEKVSDEEEDYIHDAISDEIGSEPSEGDDNFEIDVEDVGSVDVDTDTDYGEARHYGLAAEGEDLTSSEFVPFDQITAEIQEEWDETTPSISADYEPINEPSNSNFSAEGDGLKAFSKKIENEKKKLIKKAKRSGFRENFGVNVSRSLGTSIPHDISYAEKEKYFELFDNFQIWLDNLDLRSLEYESETIGNPSPSEPSNENFSADSSNMMKWAVGLTVVGVGLSALGYSDKILKFFDGLKK